MLFLKHTKILTVNCSDVIHLDAELSTIVFKKSLTQKIFTTLPSIIKYCLLLNNFKVLVKSHGHNVHEEK